jgi:imidazolonepropionase-like amidohydrolase
MWHKGGRIDLRMTIPFRAATLLLAVLAATPAAAQPANPRTLALTNATVIDGTGAAPRPDMTVVIEGGRITAVYPTAEQRVPAGAESHDLSGHFVIPGLIETHTHLTPLFVGRSRARAYAELRRMLYGGVVAARDMAGDARLVGEAARATLLGSAAGPDIYFAAVMAGPGFIATDPRVARASLGRSPGEYAWAQALTAETDVRLAVARAAGTGATAVKLYAQLEAGLIRSITEEAHRQGLMVWSHATVYPDRPIDVVRAGVNVLSHACGLGWQHGSTDPGPHREFDISSRPGFDPEPVDPEDAAFTALFEEMARRGTVLDATLAMFSGPESDRFGCTRELTVELARAAHRAGVPISTGTDFPAEDDEPYPSLHREIEYLVDHQVLTPLEAITAASLNGARAIGIENMHGTIEPGKVANLVILRANPADDIRALRSVVTVIKRGRIYSRRVYDMP